MQTAQVIACDLTKQSLGQVVAVKYSYPATTSGERINRTTILTLETIEKLTELFMRMETEPLKNPKKSSRTVVTIQRAMSVISSCNNAVKPLSTVAVAAMSWGFYNYYQEHGFLPNPVPILPRKNAKLKKGEERAPTRQEFLQAYDLSDFKQPRNINKTRPKSIVDGIGIYGEETVVKPSLEDWLTSSTTGQPLTPEEIEAINEAKLLKDLEAMDKGMLS